MISVSELLSLLLFIRISSCKFMPLNILVCCLFCKQVLTMVVQIGNSESEEIFQEYRAIKAGLYGFKVYFFARFVRFSVSN